ncbi:(2Fe-2S)-binding protein [Salinigranum rubrum]|uniref:(2Fe-2S)-binding protein n=1 Tax=Salinigranum rubrum TaxID=755307 RepID=A0A2I8VMN7_9EURY|nr:Rieske 2Fe-2S domain-containing protein [Salinigranum rubrum]AUV83155.1 (2Fe-2S)-binding protein [Salinigranum rubrum]
MTRTRLTAVDEVPENGSFLFTVRERDGTEEEVILVRCDPGADGDGENEDEGGAENGDREETVRAWRNFCQHETDQRLDRGFGAAVREGEVVCPKHGSMFDTCSGYCDNGKAADSYLSDVEVTVDEGVVYLTDPGVRYSHDGGIDDGDDGPSSTSHLSF